MLLASKLNTFKIDEMKYAYNNDYSQVCQTVSDQNHYLIKPFEGVELRW
jgi:hypothetical protein